MKDDERQDGTGSRLGPSWPEYAAGFRKGAHLSVEGELRSREYETDAGVKVGTYVIVASSIVNLRLGQRASTSEPDSDQAIATAGGVVPQPSKRRCRPPSFLSTGSWVTAEFQLRDEALELVHRPPGRVVMMAAINATNVMGESGQMRVQHPSKKSEIARLEHGHIQSQESGCQSERCE